MSITKKIINKLRVELSLGSIVFDSKIGMQETIILSSMGRSGSTILSNIINYDNTHRILFEPFHDERVSETKDFVYPLYLRPDDSEQRYLAAAHKIISGKVHSKWIDRENKTIFPKKRLIKDIRTNLFLKWVHNSFPGIKTILLLRHPCAVVSSWLTMKNFGNGVRLRHRLLANSSFVDDMDDNILNEYRKVETSFERLIFFWCIFYYIPFQQFDKDELHIVFYEDLIIDPANEFKNLFSFLDRDYLEKEVLDILEEPSSTTNKDKKHFSKGEINIAGWQKKFSTQQIDRAYEIMSLFGMEKLYNRKTSIPNKEVLNQLFKSEV